MSDTVKIMSIITDSHDTKTFEFQWDDKVSPGQFIMVWKPGMEEIPMSLSKTSRIKSITVKNIGKDTQKLCELGLGDPIRIRGPYGKGFDMKKSKNMLIIGGGVGTAAVIPVVKETGADTIIGARSAKDIIMDEVAGKYAKNLWLATDDGTKGFRGNVVQLMKEKVRENKYDMVIACGPEIMQYHLYKACVELNIDCQLSLERYMKCGAGVCGCCMMDDMRVCKDGPVFTKEQISKMSDFGVSKRDECGRLVKLG
ncbi:sulfhydrogenase 1 subunit gamma [Candidatus Methanoplasma termitum]|uniref:HydG protein n=1 Tax=Candidatus Methanoplasma termitum TaxID=1577791 RepID=A0A0A7LBT5_9ARCH|nr:dihydroorotate dehydrogenase electron transfer subunit [Candidatus Methanoplasma termitum]AIZ56478.1 sulfhydrogenase 1 subunit gamma [Candidatus Methanoplasma termitum]MCL2333445.1 dihydroorotate dehydrogenase electron transfer subunit [Candidatus Methanoplasma sp.]